MYVLITCFHESWIFYFCNCFFEKKNPKLFWHLFWFLNENPYRTDQNKWQISWKKSGLVDSEFVKTWWTLYRAWSKNQCETLNCSLLCQINYKNNFQFQKPWSKGCFEFFFGLCLPCTMSWRYLLGCWTYFVDFGQPKWIWHCQKPGW